MGYYNPYQPSPYGSPYGGYPSVGPQSPVGEPPNPNSPLMLVIQKYVMLYLHDRFLFWPCAGP